VDDFQGAGLQIDVGPSQPEELPTPEAEAQREDVQRTERLFVSGGEDGPRLRDGQAAVDLVLGAALTLTSLATLRGTISSRTAISSAFLRTAWMDWTMRIDSCEAQHSGLSCARSAGFRETRPSRFGSTGMSRVRG
jgi:hypothetical protein